MFLESYLLKCFILLAMFVIFFIFYIAFYFRHSMTESGQFTVTGSIQQMLTTLTVTFFADIPSICRWLVSEICLHGNVREMKLDFVYFL